MEDVRTGEVLEARKLWERRAVLFAFLRRFGCPLCRAWAVDLSRFIESYAELGVDIIVVGSGGETKDFIKKNIFPGRVMRVDPSANVYKQLSLPSVGIRTGFGLLDPKTHEVFNRARADNLGGDLTGSWFQLGGTWLVLSDGTTIFDFRQESPVDHADPDEITELILSHVIAKDTRTFPCTRTSAASAAAALDDDDIEEEKGDDVTMRTRAYEREMKHDILGTQEGDDDLIDMFHDNPEW